MLDCFTGWEGQPVKHDRADKHFADLFHGVADRTRETISATVSRRRRREGLRAGQRERLVAAIAAAMAEADPTPFALEGPSRHALRATLCLNGWRWQAADEAAADVVVAALARIGAKRPEWREGQREVTLHEPRTRCANPDCERPIERVDTRRTYCSTKCQEHAHNVRWNANNKEKRKVLGRQWWAAKRAAAPWVPCENCGTMFQAVASSKGIPTNCSASCAATSRNRRMVRQRALPAPALAAAE